MSLPSYYEIVIPVMVSPEDGDTIEALTDYVTDLASEWLDSQGLNYTVRPAFPEKPRMAEDYVPFALRKVALAVTRALDEAKDAGGSGCDVPSRKVIEWWRELKWLNDSTTDPEARKHILAVGELIVTEILNDHQLTQRLAQETNG